ncbi:hypothetical protein CASFOL_036565 [Castilleja foliolosa]|uniref:Uncharacterized protein n=1 Tax=Castilleja foliolosa TaxID=1961234 RepID=A0ABD3BW02_9LAMI
MKALMTKLLKVLILSTQAALMLSQLASEIAGQAMDITQLKNAISNGGFAS